MGNIQPISVTKNHTRSSISTELVPGSEATDVLYIRYSGGSMNPTLKESDLLEVLPYKMDPIQVGDVIVFQLFEEDEYTVHRAIAVEDMGVRSRGDNNNSVDPFYIQPHQVVGKVQSFWRGQKSMKLLGGTSGLIWSFFIRALREVDQRVSRKVYPLYHSLSVNNELLGKISKQFQPQIQRFESNNRVFYKVVIGDRVVGLYDQDLDIWRISRPFRLFLDDSKLEAIREL